MRVIAGSARNTPLDAGPNPATRPFLELARGALMNALTARLAAAPRVLDVYAGSGALGIEALSRGAASAVFVESDAATIRTLTANLQRCRLEKAARVLAGRAELRLPELARAAPESVDLAFVDPPFADARDWSDEPAGQAVARALARLLAPGGLVSFRMEKGKADTPVWETLVLLRDRSYGRSRVCWYGKPKAPDSP